jgi:hypothetical protein
VNKVGTGHFSVGFELSSGITLVSIFDELTRHEYLPSGSSMLFEFAVNNGVPRQSHTDLNVDHVSAPDGSHLIVNATSRSEPLSFVMSVAAGPGWRPRSYGSALPTRAGTRSVCAWCCRRSTGCPLPAAKSE